MTAEQSDQEEPSETGDMNVKERPFRYVLSSAPLIEKGLLDTMPSDETDVKYRNFKDMRQRLTDQAWEMVGRNLYPPVMVSLKHDPSEVQGPEDVNFDDLDEGVAGKNHEGLLKTSIGYDELAETMSEKGFTQTREQGGWTVFEGTHKYGKPREMLAALNDTYVAYVVRENTEEDSDSSEDPQVDLHHVIDVYIDLLNGEESLSFSEANQYGQEADRMFHEDGERWNSMWQSTSAGDVVDLHQQTGEYWPVLSTVVLTEFDGQKRFRKTHVLFENGLTQTEEQEPQEIGPD